MSANFSLNFNVLNIKKFFINLNIKINRFVSAVFLGCWLPFFTLHLTKAICMLNQTDGCVHIVATFFTTWLG